MHARTVDLDSKSTATLPRAKLVVRRSAAMAALICAMLFPQLSAGQTVEVERQLDILTQERKSLTRELDQYKKTLLLLPADNSNPEQSSNPAIRTLAREMVRLKNEIIAVTEQEVTLLQEQIAAAQVASTSSLQVSEAAVSLGNGEFESRPPRSPVRDYSVSREAENVARLLTLLSIHYTELQESSLILPTANELVLRDVAKREADTLAKIPFSADKIRLSGPEGSTSLANMTRRLTDNNIPESRRDIAVICSIKTRLYGALIASENRSLKPVGKNHYIAKIRLQPGDSTVRVGSHRWVIQLPQNINATDYIVTLYAPPSEPPEFHVFSVNDLLAVDKPHIPAWLPANIELKPSAG
jgi:hypothetical protein